jgi:TolB protein
MQPSLSPDGRRLAFAVQSLNSDLWTIPLDPASGRIAGEPRAMVATTREDSRGAWSPDGRTIAFNSDRLGDMNIWLHSLEDGTDRQLTRGPGGDYQADWSPDGRLVTFFSSRAGNADIWVVDAVAGAMRQLTQDPGLDINPFYSPTGTYIAFQSDRGGRFELWVMMADGSNPRRVARAEASGHFMRWFRDGKHILFASGDGADRKIYRVDVTSGELETMPKISSGAHLSLSPDQTRVLEVQGHRSLWIYPLDGALAAEIFMFDDPDIRIDYPVWSPDGREAVFDRGVTSGGDIWMIDGLR